MAALAILAFMGAAIAASPGPAPGDTYRFGEVMQGTPVEHVFELHNPGPSALRLAGVELSPPLQLARMPAVIPPAETGRFALTLDTAALEDEYTGALRVSFADPAQPARVFVVEGRVRPVVEVLPRPAFFLSTPHGTPKTASLDIVNHADAPLRLALDDANPAHCRLQLEELEPGRRYRLTATLLATAPTGARTERIALSRDGAATPLYVGLHTKVRERVHTFPDSVDFGRLTVAELADARLGAQTLMVYQDDGRDFAVTASSDVPGLVLEVEPGADGDRAMITATFAGPTPGPVAGTILVETNDPAFPELRVPVAGDIVAN